MTALMGDTHKWTRKIRDKADSGLSYYFLAYISARICTVP